MNVFSFTLLLNNGDVKGRKLRRGQRVRFLTLTEI